MNFNYTLIGQLLAFVLFVWFCMRFIWPQLLAVLEEREKEISEGLSAASEGRRELEEAGIKREQILTEAKKEAADLLSQANQRATQVIDEAKTLAQSEAEKIKVSAQKDLDQSAKRTKEELRSEVAALAIAGAEKILGSEIDEKKHAGLLEEISKEL